jgi:hypothetical protein
MLPFVHEQPVPQEIKRKNWIQKRQPVKLLQKLAVLKVLPKVKRLQVKRLQVKRLLQKLPVKEWRLQQNKTWQVVQMEQMVHLQLFDEPPTAVQQQILWAEPEQQLLPHHQLHHVDNGLVYFATAVQQFQLVLLLSFSQDFFLHYL